MPDHPWRRAEGGFQANPPGSKHSPPRLTPRERDEVKARYQAGETAQALALEFGVSASLVRSL